MRVVNGVKNAVAMSLVVVAVTSCSVSGDALREPDLSTKATPADAFPYGPGQVVPAANAITDITLRPRQAANRPSRCTPAAVDASTAQIRVGPGGAAGGTLTTMVVRAGDSLDEFLTQVRECPEFTLGGTVGTAVTTELVDADRPAGTAALTRVLTIGTTGESQEPLTTSITEFIAQRGNIRVYVQNRRFGPDPLSTDEQNATRALFDTARAAAFNS